MGQYFLLDLYKGKGSGGTYFDATIGYAIIFNCILPFSSFGFTARILKDDTRKRWSGFCAIVNVATMAAAATVVGYLGYHNATQLCSMVFQGMDIPAQALSVIAVGSTVLACIAAAYTSCIIMQNVVVAPVAYFVCEPEYYVGPSVIYHTSTGIGYSGGYYNAGGNHLVPEKVARGVTERSDDLSMDADSSIDKD